MMCKYWNSFFAYHDDETSEEFIFHFSSRQPAYYYAKNGKFIQTEEDDDEKNKQSYDCNETSSSAYSTPINKALDVLYTFLSELPNIKRGKKSKLNMTGVYCNPFNVTIFASKWKSIITKQIWRFDFEVLCNCSLCFSISRLNFDLFNWNIEEEKNQCHKFNVRALYFFLSTCRADDHIFQSIIFVRKLADYKC